MRVRTVVALLTGSVLVHVAVSCANGARNSDTHSIADAVADVVRDALGGTDTREAGAAPETPPTVDDVPCTTMIGGQLFAEKSFPGRSAADLSRGSVVLCSPSGVPLPGYCVAAVFWVKDGSVAVSCNGSSESKVRVVMPPPL